MADTHSHNAQVRRHEHIHITQDLRQVQQGRTWTPATTRAPPHRVSHTPRPGQRRRVLRIGPSSAAAWRMCPGTSLAMFGRSWALGRCVMG